MKQLVRTLQNTQRLVRGFLHCQHGAMLLAAAIAVLSFSGPQPRPLAAVRHRAPVPVLFDPGLALFEAQVATEALVANQLATQLTPLSGLVLYGAGLLTAVSPCCLSMLPLTTAVIAGLEQENDGLLKLRLPVAFALGLASSLALAGVVAALTGRLYGQSPGILAEALPAVIAVSMGLNLLQARPEPAQHPASPRAPPSLAPRSLPSPPSAPSQVLPFSFPSVVPRADRLNLPPVGKAFAFGAASALASSPCASPVCAAVPSPPQQPSRHAVPRPRSPLPRHATPPARLVSILGFVSQSQDPALGAALLLCYSLGSTSLVLLAGVLTGTTLAPSGPLKGVSQWVSPATGAALLTYGTYAGLGLVFP